jgi:hypothetical protein
VDCFVQEASQIYCCPQLITALRNPDMSSLGNTLGTSGGGAANVQWQIDIPSLSQLVVNLGASGLKHLAMAGVDVHSVGCLLLIANLTPTTIEYRQELYRVRESQRNERIWLYKVVEVGTATNFLADQLLKTRAGENVLALLSALLPLLPEKEFTTVLLKSFEISSIPADSTPGLGQISRIRAALNPFTARTVLKDRIVQYHGLFSQLTSTINPLSSAIPPIDVIPDVLGIFHKLVTHETPFLLHYHGIVGAAWAAAYGSKVLGLRACAILSNGDVISLNSNYDNAQVLFYVESARQEVSLRQRGNVEDIISISGLKSLSLVEMPWLINCENVNFLEYHYPNVQTSGCWEEMSNSVAEIAFSSISDELKLEFQNPLSEDLLSYPEYYLDEIQDRLLTILMILGFNPKSREFYVQRLKHSPRVSSSTTLEIHGGNVTISGAIANAVKLSVVLAFTNWHMTIRSVSAVVFESVQLHLSYLPASSIRYTSIEESILHRIVLYCTGNNPRVMERDWSWPKSSFLACDFDGTVVLRNSIYEQTLSDLKGFIWTLYPGMIIGNGEKYRHLKEEPRSQWDEDQSQRVSYNLKAVADLIRPRCILPSIALRYDISISRDTIWTKTAMLVNESTILQISAASICFNIIRMFISKPCPHPNESGLRLETYSKEHGI